MKKKYFSFLSMLLMSFSAFNLYSQAPQKFNYQAVVRDDAGIIIANQNVSLRVSILEGVATGTIVYQEEQTATTNKFGLITLEIGSGTKSIPAEFSSINWSQKAKYLQIEIDVEGGTEYADMGVSELLSVPYALYAENSGKTSDSSKTVPAIAPLNNTLRGDGTNWLSSSFLYNTGSNIGINTTSPLAALHVDNGSILFTGNSGSTPISGAGYRFMWVPERRAFRAGYVDGANWDNDSLGYNSFAVGNNTKATASYSVAYGFYTSATNNGAVVFGYQNQSSGLYSFAAGRSSIAKGDYSFAVGNTAEANGAYSIALGGYTKATGNYSAAFGLRTYAKAYSSLTIGRYNIISGDSTTWVATDPLFVIGNGSSAVARSNAFTVFKNGNASIAGQLTIYGGSPAAGKVLTSDAFGNASWVTPSSTNGWTLTGNAGTVDGTNFIGTTDAVPFNFRVNNQKAGRIDHVSRNMFLGYQSGNTLTTGTDNVAYGFQTLSTSTTGSRNTAIGSYSLTNIGTVCEATAIGYGAMRYSYPAIVDGFTLKNVAIGYEALRGDMTDVNPGNYNSALGYQALMNNSTGNYNTASGYYALQVNHFANNNTANGALALSLNTNGSDNTAMGAYSMQNNVDGDYNIACGTEALRSNVSGSNASAYGYMAMCYSNNSNVDFVNYNIAFGYKALCGSSDPSVNIGNFNSALGYESLKKNTTGNHNTATGMFALTNNETGSSNVACGSWALYENTSGSQNTAVGTEALDKTTVANHNTAVGTYALYDNVAGSKATAIGCNAMYFANNSSTPFDNYNVAVGFEALRGSTNASLNTGNANTVTGYQSMFSNSTGYENAANGYKALYENTTGYRNTAIGLEALTANTTGYYNTALGYHALYTNTEGFGNTALGEVAYFYTNNLENTTCIGYSSGGIVDASNRIEIGNASVTWIGGQVDWSTYSDRRIKDNIEEDVPGLDFITQLRPVTYNLNIHRMNEMTGKKDLAEWDSKYDIEKIKMTGFLAQEVADAAKKIGYDFSGVEIPKNAEDLYSLRYGEFVVPLVKAVQELNEKNTEQSEMIEGQKSLIEKLQSENVSQKAINENLQNQINELQKMVKK